MAVNQREIKGRLRSIKNTSKITHTMELVAAAKMRRAVMSAVGSRTYSNLAWDMLRRLQSVVTLSDHTDLMRWFTAISKPTNATIVIFTSNRGLCGAFNSSVVKLVMKRIAEYGRDHVEIVSVGKKGVSMLSSYGIPVTFAYEKLDAARNDDSIRALAQQLHQDFVDKKTDRIDVAYMDYHSSALQLPVIRELYPIVGHDSISAGIENMDKVLTKTAVAPKSIQYLYEPTAAEILNYLIPRMAEVQLYQALLESNASEHSARMLAMKNATDAAKDMASELSLAYNRARQAAITQEIAEISAGSAAVS